VSTTTKVVTSIHPRKDQDKQTNKTQSINQYQSNVPELPSWFPSSPPLLIPWVFFWVGTMTPFLDSGSSNSSSSRKQQVLPCVLLFCIVLYCVIIYYNNDDDDDDEYGFEWEGSGGRKKKRPTPTTANFLYRGINPFCGTGRVRDIVEIERNERWYSFRFEKWHGQW
jgi:hypothetical protein